MEYRYHLIKEENIELNILEENKAILVKQKGFEDFKGSTHKEYQVHGQKEHIKVCTNSTFGYTRAKDGVSYWILPYPYNAALDVVRKEGSTVISQTLTEDELKMFNFDVEEIEI